jgi:thioredoxin reductase (NADPH)
VENFPGFPDGIDGFELVDNMRKQAIKFGTIVISETVTTVDMKSETNQYFKVTTGNKSVYQANTIIIATGATAKKLSFPGSDTYWMKGISACAVCDGALPMFKNQPLAVIGGGDTAMEEATFLSKFGSMVYIVHRSGKLRASKIMQERVFANPKIKILYNHEVIEASSSGTKLEEITIVDNTNNNTNTNQTKIKVAGLFYAIGHKPASDFLAGQVKLDTEGYILTEPGTPRTSVPGLFAAGDVQDHKWRQAITAAASGCMAALEAEHYLGSIQ